MARGDYLPKRVQFRKLQSPMIVGVVEIGSRAIRLLVATVTGAGRIEHVDTAWEQIGGLLRAAKGEGAERREAIHQLQEMSLEFLRRAKSSGAVKVAIVGTAALRDVAKLEGTLLASEFPELLLFSERDEALCGLAAASLLSLQSIPSGGSINLCSIDQGAGSLEIAIGSISEKTLMLDAYSSVALGSNRLAEIVTASRGDLSRANATILVELEKLPDMSRGDGALTVGFGSALTNTAWLFVRTSPEEGYDPRRTHGTVLTCSSMKQTIRDLKALSQTNLLALRKFIDPRKPNGTEFEVIVTGLSAVLALLENMSAEQFVVSANGIRHGVAVILGKSNCLDDHLEHLGTALS